MAIPYYDSDTGTLVLPGDETGANEARIELPAAPVGTMRIDLVFRAAFHDFPENGIEGTDIYPAAWNQTNALGLSFDGAIPRFADDLAAPTRAVFDKFLGWANTAPFLDYLGEYGAAGLYAHQVSVRSASGNWGAAGGRCGGVNSAYQPVSFFDGIGAPITTITTGMYNLVADKRGRVGLPKNLTLGAAHTIGWRIWGAANDRSVYLTTAYNSNSLAESDAMFGVFDAPSDSSSLTSTIHGDTTSHWRSALDQMHFPTWLVMRYAHTAHSMRWRHGRIKYYDIDDQELAVPA